MTQSPVVKFGMYAHDVAYQAKAGRLSRGDSMALALKTLESPCADASVRLAVSRFLNTVASDPIRAGGELQDFIIAWITKLAPDHAILGGARRDEADLFGPDGGGQNGVS